MADIFPFRVSRVSRTSLAGIIDLPDNALIARGSMRDVFQHPMFDDVVIKTIRSDRIDAEGNFISWSNRKYRLPGRFGIYVSFFRELTETIRFAKNNLATGYPSPIVPIHGLIETSRGLGLVVAKLTDESGRLAPTLSRLLKQGLFTAEHQKYVDRFFEICVLAHVVLGDFHPGNLVFIGSGDTCRFVCIDGIGDKMVVPLHELFWWVNRYRLRRMRKRLQMVIDTRRPWSKTRKPWF